MDISFNEKPIGREAIIKTEKYFSSNILLVGNGVDLELERKTSFWDFLLFIKSILNFKNKKDFMNNHQIKFEFLSMEDEIKKLHCSIMRNLETEEYESLRNLYKDIVYKSWLKNKFSVTNKENVEFYNLNKDEKVKYWSDFESVIQYILGYDTDPLSPFASLKLDKITNFTELNLYEKWLRNFESAFCSYLKALDKFDNHESNLKGALDTIKSDYILSFMSRSKGLIKDIDFLNNTPGKELIINYNYTNSIEKLIKNVEKDNICYINGSIYDNYIENNNYIDNSIVIGCSLPSTCSRNHLIFDKKTRRILKNTDKYNLNKLCPLSNNNTSFNVTIFGHSCNLADSDVISFLLKHEKLKAALIFCHSYNDLVSIHNNLAQMLGRDRLNNMLDYTDLRQGLIAQKIFFGVKKERKINFFNLI